MAFTVLRKPQKTSPWVTEKAAGGIPAWRMASLTRKFNSETPLCQEHNLLGRLRAFCRPKIWTQIWGRHSWKGKFLTEGLANANSSSFHMSKILTHFPNFVHVSWWTFLAHVITNILEVSIPKENGGKRESALLFSFFFSLSFSAVCLRKYLFFPSICFNIQFVLANCFGGSRSGHRQYRLIKEISVGNVMC